MALSYRKYPHCWRKASATIRRITGYRCEQCGEPCHSVHHIGAPYANGKPGNKRDKHDIRRENLISLCFSCHDFIDNGALTFYASLRARGAARKMKHRSLNIGTGLVPLRPVRISSFHFYVFARLHYALLRWSKRTGHSRYQVMAALPASRVVDSYLVRELV
jgi:hypothetical protein